MIIMLGQGLLYRLHHDKPQMLTAAERRRAIRLLGSIMLCLIIIVLLWMR